MIIVRHGEIYTKSEQVRNQMIMHLSENLRKTLPGCRVCSKRWRLEVYCQKRNEKECARKAAMVFGVASLSIVSPVKATKSMMAIRRQAVKAALSAGLTPKKSFAVRAKRLSKEFPITSLDIGKEIGSSIWKKTRSRVDLGNPDVEVFVEVYDGNAYVFSSSLSGPGGFPLGSAGRMLLLLEDANTPAAGWMMMKRGAKLVAAKTKGKESLLKPLKRWSLSSPILVFPKPPEEVVRWKKCFGVVTSTRDAGKFEALCRMFSIPIYAPLIGLSERQLSEFRRKVIK